jgi:lipopolysaccharide export system permease protein
MLVTLPLHVLRELGKALGLAIAIFGFVLLAIAAGQMMRDGASIFTVFSVLPYLVPLVSPMVLPLTIITGTLICYGRLSATNEFSAAQAGGVHPLWIAAPGLAVATLATCVTVFLNADVLDMATVRIEKAILSDMAGILQRKLSKPGSILFYDRVI